VNLTVLGEPVGATMIAFLLPSIREVPRAGTIIGGIITLLGIGAAALRRGPSGRAGQ
jgi:Na+-translocating ferredoxin:NAD+ oxidoreductase RnfE subunit